VLVPEDTLADLTEAKKPSAQIRWLDSRGWPYEISSKGKPRVLMSVMLARMGGTVSSATASGPNWDALNGTA
jgi:hypothetical protein